MSFVFSFLGLFWVTQGFLKQSYQCYLLLLFFTYTFLKTLLIVTLDIIIYIFEVLVSLKLKLFTTFQSLLVHYRSTYASPTLYMTLLSYIDSFRYYACNKEVIIVLVVVLLLIYIQVS